MTTRLRKDSLRRQLTSLQWKSRLLLKARLIDERIGHSGKIDSSSSRRTLVDGTRDCSSTRIRNRCVDTGNPRFPIRWFRRSGLRVRERALAGKLPGVHKRSW